ncbi:MAG: hypothetical protein C0475_09230 [Planctomyces sp.]|nr:hypothetical protein [Planctomyces sp.]
MIPEAAPAAAQQPGTPAGEGQPQKPAQPTRDEPEPAGAAPDGPRGALSQAPRRPEGQARPDPTVGRQGTPEGVAQSGRTTPSPSQVVANADGGAVRPGQDVGTTDPLRVGTPVDASPGPAPEDPGEDPLRVEEPAARLEERRQAAAPGFDFVAGVSAVVGAVEAVDDAVRRVVTEAVSEAVRRAMEAKEAMDAPEERAQSAAGPAEPAGGAGRGGVGGAGGAGGAGEQSAGGGNGGTGGGGGGGGGGPQAGGDPGDASDRDSDATSVRRRGVYRQGQIDVGQGLELKTVRPRFSVATRVFGLPRPPVVEIVFGPDGAVKRARVVRASGGGDSVDEPVLNAAYQWRAVGRLLGELGPKGEVAVTITFHLQ